MSLFDDEPADVWFEEWRVAMKAHECASCGREIPKGAQSRSARWLYEGEWESARQCFGCAWHVHAILALSDRADQLLEPAPGQMASWVHELLDWYDEDAPIYSALRAASQHLEGVGPSNTW